MWIIAIIAIIAIVIFVKKSKAKNDSNNQETTATNKKEEVKKQKEEENRFDPEDKSLEWFCSEDGLKTFDEYTTAQNYLLEETIKKEKEEKYNEYDLEMVVSVIHKNAKLPFVFFKNLIKNIKAQSLEYVGPIELVVEILSLQAKPFYIDDDGEPKPKNRALLPEEIVSIEKNPVLKYVSNFNCFELADDAQGTWEDKWNMWSKIMFWLCSKCITDKDVISKNPWIFSKDTYLNELGTARKMKGFYKKCIELAADEDKKYFEEKLKVGE